MNKKIIGILLGVVLLSSCTSNNTTETANIEVVQSSTDSVVVDSIPQPQRIAIKMNKEGGVYTIPCLVNGVKMDFIFDTGASSVCISLTEALFLYKNGYITDDDIGGESKSQVADGRITTNTKLKLNTIEIKGIVLRDVDAIVVSSIEAPLLLGQSAIQKLGKYEVDGDSLFITGIVEKPQPIEEVKEEIFYAIPPSNPQISWWDKVKTFFGNDDKINDFLIKASAARMNDLPDLGILYCTKALECNNKSAKAYGLRGHIYFWDEKYECAFDDYMAYFKYNTNRIDLPYSTEDTVTFKNVATRMLLCCIETTISGVDPETNQKLELLALQYAQEAYQKHPDYAFLVHTITRYYINKREWDKAERWIPKLEKISLSDAYFYKAYIAKELGRNSEALKYYQKVLDIVPESSGTLNNMSNIYSAMGQQQKAIELRKQAARLGSKSSQEWLKDNGYEW